MKIVVIGDDVSKKELNSGGIESPPSIQWMGEIQPVNDADCYLDLLFNNSKEYIEKLFSLAPALLIINSVENTLAELPAHTVRINGWHGFLNGNTVEACGAEYSERSLAEKVFSVFHKTIKWVEDLPGMIAPRVISMIINEAYWALHENISHKKKIDTAMKLGANYPFGPFEWAEKIGLKKIHSLLNRLSANNQRYAPCPLLREEAGIS